MKRFKVLALLSIVSFVLVGQTWAGEPTDCQSHLLKLLSRVAKEKHARVYNAGESTPVHELQPTALNKILSRPQFEGNIHEQGVLKFSVASAQEMFATLFEGRKKGFWLIFNPSRATDNPQTGHFQIAIGDQVFNRMGDGLGSLSMESMPLTKALAAWSQAGHPYMTGQYFELTEESTAILQKFFHQRVWEYHAGNRAPWHSTYAPLPFTRDKGVVDAENCLSFSLSFLEDRFLNVMPELAQVRREMGSLTAVQVPIRQFFYNAQNAAHRGTVVFSLNADALRASMLDGSFNHSVPGNQMFLDGPIKPLYQPTAKELEERQAAVQDVYREAQNTYR